MYAELLEHEGHDGDSPNKGRVAGFESDSLQTEDEDLKIDMDVITSEKKSANDEALEKSITSP